MHIVQRIDASYSADVEIDENGRVVFARDIAQGEAITIPIHMLDKVARSAVVYHWPPDAPA